MEYLRQWIRGSANRILKQLARCTGPCIRDRVSVRLPPILLKNSAVVRGGEVLSPAALAYRFGRRFSASIFYCFAEGIGVESDMAAPITILIVEEEPITV